MIIVFFIYIPYIVVEFCCSYKAIFSEQKTPLEMKALIGNLFTNSPSIDFVCEIYEHDTITDSEGNQDTKSIYINSEFDHLNILSSRDVSGVLNFNYEGYSYAYLDIEVEVNFADTISYDDYITKKKKFEKEKKAKHNHGSYSTRFREDR